MLPKQVKFGKSKIQRIFRKASLGKFFKFQNASPNGLRVIKNTPPLFQIGVVLQKYQKFAANIDLEKKQPKIKIFALRISQKRNVG